MHEHKSAKDNIGPASWGVVDLHRGLGSASGGCGRGGGCDAVLGGQWLDSRVAGLHLLGWLHWFRVPGQGEAALASGGVVHLY